MAKVNTKEIRYDEIKVGDVIFWHGAKEIVKKVFEFPAPANEWFPDEVSITFELEPADEEAVRLLGNFYSHGTYGGVGCLTAELVID